MIAYSRNDSTDATRYYGSGCSNYCDIHNTSTWDISATASSTATTYRECSHNKITRAIVTRVDVVPIGFWPELFEDAHKVPNYYAPAPQKLEFKSLTLRAIHRTFKQPVSRSGFKRGQRNGQHKHSNHLSDT